MSDTNRVGIRFAKTAASEFPVALSPNQLQQLRYTGAPNLAYTPRTIQSTEIRSDRQISDLPLVGAEAGGDVNFELSAQAYDDVIESALLGAWVDPGRKAGAADITVITRTAGNTVVTLDDASDFVIGHIVRLSGVDGVGNGVFLVTAKSGQALTLGTVVDGSQAAGTVSNRAAAVFEVVGVGARSAGAFDITVASGVLSVVGPSGSFNNAMGDGANLSVGQWIKIAGAATAGNNVWMRLDSVSGSTLTGAAPTGSAAETVAGSLRVYFGGYVRNGVADLDNHKYVVERRYEDHSPVTREAFLGMVVNTLQFQLQPQSIATGTVSFFGETSQVEETVANLYGSTAPTDVDASQNEVLNTSSNVGRLGRGADPADQGDKNFVIGADIQITNNLRRRAAVGHLGSVGTGVGALAVTGTLNTYFDDRTHLVSLFQNQETSLDVSLKDNTGRSILLDFPRIKFSGGAPEVAGQNQDVTLNLPFQALLDADLGYTIHAQRLSYAA